MKPEFNRMFRVVLAYVGLLLLTGAVLWGGWQAVAGFSLGVVSGCFGTWSLYAMIRLLKGVPASPISLSLTVMGFLSKFPLIGIAGYCSWKLGIPSLTLFTIAIVVVYLAMVWRASRSDLF